MDFKVAGTREGVTAIQLDNKLGAVPAATLAEALEQARAGRLHILDEMEKALAAPRPELKPGAPRVSSLRIRRERIRDLIGSGGKTIQEIQQAAGVKVDIDDDGLVRVYAPSAAATAEALRRIRAVTLEPEVGQVFRAEVVLVRDFFAIVRLAAGVEAKLPIGEVESHRIGKVQDVLKPGDATLVRVLGVDAQGKILASRRAAKDADEADAVL
jgi:polyribonucleotide nucleotidyltransferase